MYGRDVETRRLFEMLVAERIVLLHAPSGAGKSSLVRAGLVPLLKQEGFHVLAVARVNTDPNLEIPDGIEFNRYAHSTLLSLETGLPQEERTPADKLVSTSLKDYLDQRPRQPDEPELEVLLIDQFEEILTTAPNDREGKLAFFQQLGDALRNPQRWALISMREDYLGALDPYLRPVPTRLSHTFRLDFLSVSAAIEAVRRPPQDSAGVIFTPTAAQALVDDLRTTQVQQPDGSTAPEKGPIVEPVQLQVVCYRLWENLAPDDMEIGEDDLASVGDVDESLAQYYQSSLEAVSQKLNTSPRLIREWFEFKLISEGRRSTIRKDLTASGELDNNVIEALRDAHLVRAEQRAGATWYELAHDRLIGPVMKNNAAWFQSNLSLLQRQATIWERRGRPDNLLLSGPELGEASQWAESNSALLIPRDNDLLEASLDAEQSAQLNQRIEAERQRAEEKARAAARLRRLLILALAAMAVAVIFGLVAVYQTSQALKQKGLAEANSLRAENNAATATSLLGVANVRGTQVFQEKLNAEQQEQIAEAASTKAVSEQITAVAAQNLAEGQKATAEAASTQAVQNAQVAATQAGLASSRQLAAQAQSNELTNLSLAYLLAVEAYNTNDTFEARNILFNRLLESQGSTLQPFGAEIPKQDTYIYEVAFSPTDPYLAWGDREGNVVVWDYNTGAPKWQTSGKSGGTGFGHKDNVWAVDFSPDGKLLATGGQDQTIILWNVETQKAEVVSTNPKDVRRLKFNSDGTKLAAANQGNLQIYDTSAGRLDPVPLTRPIRQAEDFNAVTWSPDDQKLVTGSDDGMIMVWDARTGANQRKFQTGGVVLDVEWQPGTNVVAAANTNHDVIFYDTSLGREVLPRLVHDATPNNNNQTAVYSIAFSHDGKLLASAGNDNRLIIWDPVKRLALEDLPFNSETGPKYQLRSVDFSDDLKPDLVATGGTDGYVRLFEVRSKQPLSELAGKIPGSVVGISIASDEIRYSAGDPIPDRYNPRLRHIQFRQDEKATWQSPSGYYPGIFLNANSSDTALGDESGQVTIFDTLSGEERRSSFTTGSGRLTSLALNSVGSFLVTAHCIDEDPAGPDLSPGTIIFNDADSNMPTTCTNSEIRFWNLAVDPSSAPAQTGVVINLPGNPISALSLNLIFTRGGMDGLVAAATGASIQVINVKTGEPIGLPLEGHGDLVTSLAFRDDGTILASASQDKTIRLWDTRNFQTIGAPLETSSTVLSLAFDPSQIYLYSGDESGNIYKFLASPEVWKERLCSLAGRNMNEDEAGVFLVGKPIGYKTCPNYP